MAMSYHAWPRRLTTRANTIQGSYPLHEIMSQELVRQRSEIDDLRSRLDETEVERQLEREIHRENAQQRILQLEEEVRRLKQAQPEVSPQVSPAQSIMNEPEIEEEVELMKKFIGRMMQAQQKAPPQRSNPPEATDCGESTPREACQGEFDAMTGFLNQLESACRELSQRLAEREEECINKDMELAMCREQMRRMAKQSMKLSTPPASVQRSSWDVPVPTAIVVDGATPRGHLQRQRTQPATSSPGMRLPRERLQRMTTGCQYPLPEQRMTAGVGVFSTSERREPKPRSSVASVPAEISRSIVSNFQKLFSSAK